MQGENLKTNKKISPLDYILNGKVGKEDDLTLATDTFYGPVSVKAQAILQTIATEDTAFKSTLFCMLLPPKMLIEARNLREKEVFMKHYTLFIEFCSKLKERDSRFTPCQKI